MFRRRLSLSFLLAGAAQLGVLSCARELDFKEPVDASSVVRAQFDPTNPIPVLRLVPTPFGLVQKPETGDLDYSLVAPQACEAPSTKQCLQFVKGGWPTSAPITLFFSGDLDQATIPQGVKLFEIAASGAATPVPFEFTVGPRPAPNAACQGGDNGSALTYSEGDVPPGNVVVLNPEGGMKPSTRYVLLAVSAKEGGLRASDGRLVEPSALFHLLNVPQSAAPVTSDGTLVDGLLRNNVIDSVLRNQFDGRSVGDLDETEKATFDAAIAASGKQLFGLYSFFSAVIDPLVTAGTVQDRNTLVFANTWTTTFPVVELDPGASKVPFPNAEILTATSASALGGLVVALPNPSNNPIIEGLNTLNGFATTASITFTTTAEVDPLSIDPTPSTPCSPDDCAIVMYPVGANDLADQSGAVDLIAHVIPGSHTSTVTIAPALPLAQNQRYVIAVKRGLKSPTGAPVASATAFELLKLSTPFIESGVVPETVPLPGGQSFPLKQALECSFVARTGQLGSETDVQGAAAALELQVHHDRWQKTLAALEGASTPISRSDLILAFSYKTQSITTDLDFIKSTLLEPTTCSAQSPCWELLLAGGPRVEDGGVTVRGRAAIAQAIGVPEQLCLPACQAGALAPTVPSNQCQIPDGMGGMTLNPAVTAHPICQQIEGLITSRLGELHRYILKGFKVTAGNPYVAGTFTTETVAQPTVVDLPFWVITPTTAQANETFPVTIVQHGLGRRKEDGFLMANTLAAAGRASVMIDMPFHGERATDIARGNELCTDVDPANVDCTGATCVDRSTGMAPCDGLRDDSGNGFLSVNLFSTRDNFRQAVIDQLTLLRAIRLEGRLGGALPELQGANVTYVGQSLGGIAGANLAAYVTAQEISKIVLNVAGGGLLQNIIENTVPEIAAPLFAGVARTGNCTLKDPTNPGRGCEDTPAYRRFGTIARWVLEPADPLATSIGVTQMVAPGRAPLGSNNVLMQVSIPDPVVSNISSYALASTYFADGAMNSHFQSWDFSGLPQSTDDSGCHGFLFAPICGRCLIENICNTVGAQVQAATFMTQNVVVDRATALGLVRQATGIDCANACP